MDFLNIHKIANWTALQKKSLKGHLLKYIRHLKMFSEWREKLFLKQWNATISRNKTRGLQDWKTILGFRAKQNQSNFENIFVQNTKIFCFLLKDYFRDKN